MTGKAIAEKAGSDPDEMLSDHQWKTKMAAEGKAIYVPGKTVAEMAEQTAKASAQKVKLETRELALSNAQWSQLDTAIPDIIEMVNDVRNVFYDMAYQEDLDMPGVNSTMRLAARAILSFMGNELSVLDDLDFVIRHSKKGSNNAPVK